jgi:hypothetical protein
VTPFLGRDSEGTRSFSAETIDEEGTATLVGPGLPKMLQKISILSDGGLVLKLRLVFNDEVCIVAIE